MKKLIFTKGDETRPKFEDLTNDDICNSSIFSDIYDRAFSLINEIANPPKFDNTKYNRKRNNIIAFIGERGSGKTSCLKSIYHSLYKDNPESRPHRISKTNTTFNNKLPIIDPSYFDEHSNIVEIVIAHMFKSFKDVVNRSNHSLDGDNLEKKRKLVKKFQEVKDALDCTKARDIRFNSNDSIEQLSKLASGSNLHDSMEKLVEYYLDYFKSENDKNSQMLVIAIDDLDVQTNHTYQMVEQIRKYLIIDNVLILMGVKLVQLSDLIKKKFVEDFKYKEKDKDNNIYLNDQIDDMVARYLMKLLPLSHRLNLPSYIEIPKIELEINGDNVGKIGGLSIEDATLKIIYAKTHMMFYNTYEHCSMIVPFNLRELLNLLSMLTTMQSLHPIQNNDKKSEIKRQNRDNFRHYFVESWCLDKLTSKQYSFIKEVENCDAININKFIIDYLYREYELIFRDEKCKIDKAIVNLHNRGYNVSIADVYYILDHLIGIDESSIKRLVFAIKTIYSIRLYNTYYEMMSHESLDLHSTLLADYQIKSKVYKAINKNNHLFDYEKMIGGNILYIDLKDDKDGKDGTQQCLYAGVVSTSILRQIYNGIVEKYNGLPDSSPEQIQNCIDENTFNVFEFFLLSTMYYSKPSYARTHKLCHYNSFPVRDYPSTGELTFNFTSIISNIIRYYNLYRKYEYLKGKNYNNKSFNTFFNIVNSLKTKSLIYKIKDAVSKKNEDGYEVIENIAIHNVEVLELLEDYLGNINKLRIAQNDDANLNRICTLIADMSKFKYYRYTGDIRDTEYELKDIGYKCIGIIFKFLEQVQKNPEMKKLFFNIYNNE